MEEEKSALTLLQCYSSDSENEDGEDGSMSHQQIGSSKELEPPKGGSTSTVVGTSGDFSSRTELTAQLTSDESSLQDSLTSGTKQEDDGTMESSEDPSKCRTPLDRLPSLTKLGDSLTEPTEPEGAVPAQFIASYREAVSSSSDSDSSDSDSSSNDDEELNQPKFPVADDENEVEDEDGDPNGPAGSDRRASNLKSKMLEDLGILDLAPLEDLKITVAQEECIPIGTVHNIIDMLVIVAARRGCPAIDLDSVLFLDQGRRFLGQVFDVFGPVGEPMYMVRFNSAQDIVDQGVQLGTEVFFAPRTRHTAYVFIDSLIQQKGSDASWENDQEPPEHCLDYSDDEQEMRAKAAHRLKKRTTTDGPDADPNAQPPPGRPMARGRRRNNPGRGRGGYHRHPAPPPANPFYMMRPPPPSGPPAFYSAHHPPPGPQQQQHWPSPYSYPPPPPPPH